MNIYHNRVFQGLRTLARRLGVLSVIKRIYGGGIYEDAFHKGMQAAIKPGDIVWDIGANIGYYTEQFAAWSGPDGRIIAFEPLPTAIEKLNLLTTAPKEKSSPVQICPVALSEKEGTMLFEIVGQGIGAVTTTSRILERKADGVERADPVVEIQVETADCIAVKAGLPGPNVTKIDVEGFEEDVLLGGPATWGSKGSRHIFVEVHFTRLHERKRGDAPARMVKLLKSWGYHVTWLDASHLHAARP